MALKPASGVSLSYEFEGYNRVRNSLRKLASEYRETTDGTVKDWTKGQRGTMKSSSYPPQTFAPQPFKTARQRRWFFWALKTGQITVPYSRTGTIANSWRTRKEGWSHWVLENSAPYAALVVGRGTQARYHRDNWWIADDIIDDDVGDLTTDLSEEIVDLAKGME